MINKMILIGWVGQEPKMFETEAKKKVARFRVATNESWVDQSGQKQTRTTWHSVVAWDKLAETCGKFLTKGKQVYIEGPIYARPLPGQWQVQEDQKPFTPEVREIQARVVKFLGPNVQSEMGESSLPPISPETPFKEDDIPF